MFKTHLRVVSLPSCFAFDIIFMVGTLIDQIALDQWVCKKFDSYCIKGYTLWLKQTVLTSCIVYLFWFQCKIYWQQKGDYLGVKVDRYTKSKKVSHFFFKVDCLCCSWSVFAWGELNVIIKLIWPSTADYIAHFFNSVVYCIFILYNYVLYMYEICSMWWSSPFASSAAEIKCWELGEKLTDN